MKQVKNKDCGFVVGRKSCEEGSCLCTGRLPMRKEIVWNAGMHSHPKCLNKLVLNEAVKGEERETTIRSAGERPTTPGESHIEMHLEVRATVRTF